MSVKKENAIVRRIKDFLLEDFGCIRLFSVYFILLCLPSRTVAGNYNLKSGDLRFNFVFISIILGLIVLIVIKGKSRSIIIEIINLVGVFAMAVLYIFGNL